MVGGCGPGGIFAEHGLRLAGPDRDVAAEGWLVLVTVTNTGLIPVRGRDFRAPSGFRFPGREVCAARICPDPAAVQVGGRPPVLPSALSDCGASTGGSRGPGIALGTELLLRRDDAFALMAVLRGAPVPELS